jgi:hypothetical protein
MHESLRNPTPAEIEESNRRWGYLPRWIQDKDAVHNFLRKVPPQHQLGLIAHFRDFKKNKEAAAIAGMPVAAFRTIRDAARAEFAITHTGPKHAIDHAIFSAMSYSLEVYAIAGQDAATRAFPDESVATHDARFLKSCGIEAVDDDFAV